MEREASSKEVRTLFIAGCMFLGCSRPASTSPASGGAPSPAVAASAAPLPATSAGAEADPHPDEDARTDAPADADARAGAEAVAANVRVYNIGMHIGGGPNDDETKAPIHKSVSPHFAEITACFPSAASPPVDFGVDLVIEAKGGKAQVARPRTKLADDAFIACVVGVFQGIDFLPPRFGKTVVSYSLRFDRLKPK